MDLLVASSCRAKEAAVEHIEQMAGKLRRLRLFWCGDGLTGLLPPQAMLASKPPGAAHCCASCRALLALVLLVPPTGSPLVSAFQDVLPRCLVQESTG